MPRFGAKHAVGGLVLYAGGVYAGMLYSQGRKKATGEGHSVPQVTSETRAKAYDENAKEYDGEIWLSEFLGGINGFRRSLLKHAEGKTLEVAAGTGRNMGYYPKSCSLVLSDRSGPMLDIAKSKAEVEGVQASFIVQDVSAPGFENEEFDTVVDTFGLCSFDDPVQALKEMQRVLKPGGKVLLLEHGRSEWNFNWLNNFLDNRAESHGKKWGCLWNRNINDIVEASGLKIIKKTSHHFGTCYEIIAEKQIEK